MIAALAFVLALSPSSLESSIGAAEYEISVHDGVHQAPNREHGFRTRFLETGIVVVPRTEVERPWWWGLAWTAYGRGEVVGPVPSATLSAKGRRIDYLRGGHLEWYENSERGLKQNFRLAAPPEGGAGEVRVDLALTGDLNPVISEDGQTIDFVRGSERVLRYSGLIVTDARGNPVPARMEGFVRGIRIVLDDADAVYPITIDPLVTGPAWIYESNQTLAELGTSVATAGDVNGDGYSDVLVGAPYFDNGQTDEGRVFLFLGSASGLATNPSWTAEADQAGAFFGQSVGTAGDVNGDGYADVIVGASAYDDGETDEGRAYVYHGSASGLSTAPAWTAEGNQTSAQYGWSVSTAGDVNGDGYSDVIVGTFGFDNGQTDEGRAWVYLGSSSGLSTTASWTAESNQAFAQFGNSVSTAGDVNGDGYADVVVGAPGFDNGQTNEGRAYVYLGSASGLSATPAWTAESDQASASFGWSVSTAGDANGDAYADVVVGAPDFDNGQADEGRAYLYHGSGAGPSAIPSWTAESNQALARFGNAVATAGDVDGDGHADVLIGAEFFNGGQGSEGRAHLFRGTFSSLGATPQWTAEPNYVAAYFGRSLATAGDVNGDGLSDVVVGAPGYDNGQNEEGRVYVYLGGLQGLSSVATTTTQANANSRHGEAVASAGDVNGDGYADLVVGTPGFDFPVGTDNGRAALHLGSSSGTNPNLAWAVEGATVGAEMGRAVAGAGDVNGDGYDDVLVAAPRYGLGGRVQLHLGSAVGLARDPSWTRDGDQQNAEYGGAVSSAGDVNGDGYADVIVGAPSYDGAPGTDAGRVDLFLGGPVGLAATPAFTVWGTQAGARLGHAVGSAGDVNGDGYADVVLGEPQFDPPGLADAGRISVYRGSATGLSQLPTTENGTQAEARFGSAVSSAGDVNGDGFGDVVVGEPLRDAVFADAGSAYLYLGSASGIAATPAWNLGGSGLDARFGESVAGAGDLNGDGFADVAIGESGGKNGQSGEGIAYAYLGSASGLPATASWTAEGEQSFADFGFDVGAAGDVNGDGFADLVVGAPLWDGAGVDQGRSWVFYGGGERGRARRPVQRAFDDSRPVARFGASEAPGAFRIATNANSPFGRGKVRIETEVEAYGTPFDGVGTWISDVVDTQGGLGPVVGSQEQGFEAGTRLRWRVRRHFDLVKSPYAPPSDRWITIPWGASTEPMLRTLSGPAGRASELRVEKVGAGVTVTYQTSCLSSDTLHAVFEGTLGDFVSHVPVTCASPGSSWNLTPQAGNRYFLVVPLNPDFEGSYGTTHLGVERLQGPIACKAQNVGVCP